MDNKRNQVKRELTPRERLQELYRLRDKFKIEILGQTDPEYRELCEDYVKAISDEIRKLVAQEEEQNRKERENDPWAQLHQK